MNSSVKKIALFFLAIIVAACGQKNSTKKKTISKKKKEITAAVPVIRKPFKNADVSFEEFIIDADSNYTLTAKNNYGTSLTIIAGNFINDKKEKVSGKIKIRYREMQTVYDILISGIPLNYDAAGMLKRFHSAGMFEIRAYQNNNEVFLDSGKVIAVNFASFIDEGKHHAFYLDEKNTRNWNYLKDLETQINPEKKKIFRKARSKVKEFNVPLEGYFAFNYMALLDVYLNDKSVEIQKKRSDLTLQGKIKDYGVTWTNVYCYQSIDFMGNKYLASLLLWKKLNNEAWPVWASTALCNLTPNTDGTYKLELSQAKGKGKYTAHIKPFFPIKSLLAFSPSYWKNKYNLAVRKAVEEEMRKNKIADVFRTLEVHAFGVYNVDRLQKEEDYVQVEIAPDFGNAIEKINEVELIYISEAYRTVIRYPKSEWKNITLLPDDGAKLIAVLPGNKLAVADVKNISNLNYKTLKENPHTKINISFTIIEGETSSALNIAEVLGLQEKAI